MQATPITLRRLAGTSIGERPIVGQTCTRTALMVDSAVAKGCTSGKGRLWFIGLFLTPLALGLAAIGMPDRRNLS